jgi:hypothetical protein
MTEADCTRPKASLTGGSGYRWLLHEGVAEALRVSSMEDEVHGWWLSLANRGGGREWRVERAGWHECGGGKGKTSAQRAPLA